MPIPLDNTHYVSVSELQKIFEICEESFKIPFGYGRRWVEFYWTESAIFSWSVKIMALAPRLQKLPESGKRGPTSHHGIWRRRSWPSREDTGMKARFIQLEASLWNSRSWGSDQMMQGQLEVVRVASGGWIRIHWEVQARMVTSLFLNHDSAVFSHLPYLGFCLLEPGSLVFHQVFKLPNSFLITLFVILKLAKGGVHILQTTSLVGTTVYLKTFTSFSSCPTYKMPFQGSNA